MNVLQSSINNGLDDYGRNSLEKFVLSSTFIGNESSPLEKTSDTQGTIKSKSRTFNTSRQANSNRHGS